MLRVASYAVRCGLCTCLTLCISAGVTVPGCTSSLRPANTLAYIPDAVRANDDSNARIAFKTWVLYPGRDVLTFDPLVRLLCGDEAWNADIDLDRGTSFCVPRPTIPATPAEVARGSGSQSPQPPFRVLNRGTGGGSSGFVGRDATGRKFLFKLDDPSWPGLGTSADLIGARILGALGYRVPPIHLVAVTGTGDPELEGRRACAALFIENSRGHFRFDWFRYRREVRALRIASAWINDVDRGGRNNLVVEEDGRVVCYLIDFNSCLGSWEGRPKEPWRGWQHEGDPRWTILRTASLGLLHPEPDPRQPIVSPAVGRFDAEFDPLAWLPQSPNTAFDHLTPADLRWIADRIRALERPHIEAIVAAAHLPRPEDAAYLIETLLARRQRILDLADAPR